MTRFKINNYLDVICQAEKTRNGFRHIATLLVNRGDREKVTINYLNRTWERYQYESVLEKLLNQSSYVKKNRNGKVLEKLYIQQRS